MRVLVVDDNCDVGITLGKLLEQSGYESRYSSEPRDALQVAEEWRPEVVLLDLSMPEMDGYSVAVQLRNKPGLEKSRIYLLSGYQADAIRQRNCGIDGHFLKPTSIQQIRRVIEECAS